MNRRALNQYILKIWTQTIIIRCQVKLLLPHTQPETAHYKMAAVYQPMFDLQHAAHTSFQCSLHVQPLLRMYSLVVCHVQFLEHLHISDIGTGPLAKGLQATSRSCNIAIHSFHDIQHVHACLGCQGRVLRVFSLHLVKQPQHSFSPQYVISAVGQAM